MIRRTPLRRGRRLPPINRERVAKALLKHFGPPERREWVAADPCDTCGRAPPCQNSHVVSRGSGRATERDIIGQCPICHGEMGQIGILSFQVAHDCDLSQLAKDRAERWDRRQEEAA